jgi:hypothetical protein
MIKECKIKKGEDNLEVLNFGKMMLTIFALEQEDYLATYS